MTSKRTAFHSTFTLLLPHNIPSPWLPACPHACVPFVSLKLHDKSGKNDDGIAAASDGGGGGEGDNASLPVGDGFCSGWAIAGVLGSVSNRGRAMLSGKRDSFQTQDV